MAGGKDRRRVVGRAGGVSGRASSKVAMAGAAGTTSALGAVEVGRAGDTGTILATPHRVGRSMAMADMLHRTHRSV